MKKQANNPKVKILVAYHKPYYLFKNELMCPIQGGRLVADKENKDGYQDIYQKQWLLGNTIGDDSGENISSLNRYFNEMTIEYWVWKNYENIGNPDYIGFMQYRRQFILNPKFSEFKRSDYDICYSMFRVYNPDDTYINTIGLTEENILNLLKDYDVILPKKSDFSLIGLKSVREDYEKRIPGVHIEDLDKFTAYLKKTNKDFGEYFEEKTYETKKHLYLCFITSREIFMQYAEFVFPILLEFRKQIDVSGYTINGQRTMGYLAETLYGIYFEYMSEKEGIRLKEVDIAMIQNDGLPEKNKYKLLGRYLKYWLASKIFFGAKRKQYKKIRKDLRNKLMFSGHMIINDEKMER